MMHPFDVHAGTCLLAPSRLDTKDWTQGSSSMPFFSFRDAPNALLPAEGHMHVSSGSRAAALVDTGDSCASTRSFRGSAARQGLIDYFAEHCLGAHAVLRDEAP